MRPTSQPTRVLIDLLRLLGWPQGRDRRRQGLGRSVEAVVNPPPRDHEAIELMENEALDRREPLSAHRLGQPLSTA